MFKAFTSLKGKVQPKDKLKRMRTKQNANKKETKMLKHAKSGIK